MKASRNKQRNNVMLYPYIYFYTPMLRQQMLTYVRNLAFVLGGRFLYAMP